MLPRLFASLAILAAASQALANDTMAELKTGGLHFVQSAAVSMEKEDLFISPREIRVAYVFRNNSDKDVTSLVAFPMPDIQGGPIDNIAIDDFNVDNFLGFTVTQAGKPIRPNLQQRALAMDVDQTDILKEMGIPLLPQAEATMAALKTLSAAQLQELASRGLIQIDEIDTGNGMEKQFTALWTLKSSYWWKTTFPAGRDVAVAHRYKPSVGGTVAVTFVGDDDYNKAALADYRKRFCIDDTFLKTANKVGRPKDDGTPTYVENWISYVLTTGANWYGPIKEFRLTIDKGDKANFVSFCGEGVTKTGPTTFEMKKTDFSPEQDIDILLLVKMGE